MLPTHLFSCQVANFLLQLADGGLGLFHFLHSALITLLCIHSNKGMQLCVRYMATTVLYRGRHVLSPGATLHMLCEIAASELTKAILQLLV